MVAAACIAAVVVVILLLKGPAAAVIAPIVVGLVILVPLVIVQPGETRLVRFFGSDAGTVRRTGLWPILPLANRRNVSSRVRNFETNHSKVNDEDGNPVEIPAMMVRQVADTSRAVYAADHYLNFVHAQAESALPQIATTHPYDDPAGAVTSLRRSTDRRHPRARPRGSQRAAIAGVEIGEVRISHRAYASQIAQAMLRRQQANAVVAARAHIVEGAVSMVQPAPGRLNERNIVELDEERKAAMVTNPLVALCGDRPAPRSFNTGTL